jgi:hypothetical protein
MRSPESPRVNDKRADPATGERMRFSSAILPPWARKTPKVTEVLPLLYLHARRGMRAPVLAIGDGALGFWSGLREVFPQATEARCWFHKTANVLAALPRSSQPSPPSGTGPRSPRVRPREQPGWPWLSS